MKYRILAVIIILVALISITVSATGYEYTITPSDNFTAVKYGDDLSKISKKLNMSNDELNSYFHQSGLLYLAVSEDNQTQIKLSAFSDNFSSAAGDISNLDSQALTEFVSAVNKDAENNADIIENNGRKFVCVKNTRKDSGGVYTVTQYITICDNQTFYFAGYNPGEDTADEITLAFESFNLQEKAPETPNYSLLSTLIIAGIVIFASLAVSMIIGVIKVFFKNHKEQLNNEI